MSRENEEDNDDHSELSELGNLVQIQELGWLVDVPLFLDKRQTGQLYDLVVEPVFKEYRLDKSSAEISESETETESVEGEINASLGVGGLLSSVASGSFGASVTGSNETTRGNERVAQYAATQTAQRRLAQVVIEYKRVAETGDEHYHFVDYTPSDEDDEDTESDSGGRINEDWLKPTQLQSPRPLVVLKLPGIEEIEQVRGGGTERDEKDECVPVQLVPTAAEFEDGTVEELYQRFESRYEKPPRYPQRGLRWEELGPHYDELWGGKDRDSKNGRESNERREVDGSDKIDEHVAELREHYWKWFEREFNGKRAMRLIEEAAEEHGDIRWIDFRLPLDDAGRTLHLHMQGREEYSTGVYGYNLVKRGYKHGLLLIGTIKSGNDMDVLAVYER